MRKQLILISVLLVSLFGFSQSQVKNEFIKDTLHHNNNVNKFIMELKLKGIDNIILLSDYNFVSNDTYIYWKNQGKLVSRLLSNKKLKKRIKNKKNCLSGSQSKSVSALFDLKNDYSFLKQFDYCQNEVSHHYRIKLNIQDNDYFINSTCLTQLKKDKLIGVLFQVLDSQ